MAVEMTPIPSRRPPAAIRLGVTKHLNIFPSKVS